jgi:hypothetical protein
MTSEQLLIEAWRRLPERRQREVLDFTQFLAQYSRNEFGKPTASASVSKSSQPKLHSESSALGKKLQSIRGSLGEPCRRIVALGMPLLTLKEAESEALEHRALGI